VESEIARLNVWINPANEPGRALVVVGALERTIVETDWAKLIERAWKFSPAMAVHMGERFKYGPVQAEITRLVKADPKAVLDVPEALHYLLGERVDASSKAALKVCETWLY